MPPTLTRVFTLRTAPTPGNFRLGAAVMRGRAPVTGELVHAHARPQDAYPATPEGALRSHHFRLTGWTCSQVNCGGYT